MFDPIDERVFLSPANFGLHFGTFYVPDMNVVGNTPIRMRVWSDFTNFGPDPSPCDAPVFGQVEDYSVVLTGDIGIDENALANAISIVPNPTDGHTSVNIDLPSSTPVQLTLFNAMGQVVHASRLSGQAVYRHALDLSSFANGVYYLEASTDNNKAVKKIVVQ